MSRVLGQYLEGHRPASSWTNEQSSLPAAESGYTAPGRRDRLPERAYCWRSFTKLQSLDKNVAEKSVSAATGGLETSEKLRFCRLRRGNRTAADRLLLFASSGAR